MALSPASLLPGCFITSFTLLATACQPRCCRCCSILLNTCSQAAAVPLITPYHQVCCMKLSAFSHACMAVSRDFQTIHCNLCMHQRMKLHIRTVPMFYSRLPCILDSSKRAGIKPSLREAYEHTCAMKPNIMPNPGFFTQLVVCSHAAALQLLLFSVLTGSAPHTATIHHLLPWPLLHVHTRAPLLLAAIPSISRRQSHRAQIHTTTMAFQNVMASTLLFDLESASGHDYGQQPPPHSNDHHTPRDSVSTSVSRHPKWTHQ